MSFVDIFVVGNLTVVGFLIIDLYDTICNGVHKLLVVRGKEHTTAVVAKTVVQSGDRFEVEVVGRLVENKEITAF